MTDAGTAEAILGLLTGQDKSSLDLRPLTEESEPWGPASSQQQPAPAQTVPICFDACLDIATCYAAPVHPRYPPGCVIQIQDIVVPNHKTRVQKDAAGPKPQMTR